MAVAAGLGPCTPCWERRSRIFRTSWKRTDPDHMRPRAQLDLESSLRAARERRGRRVDVPSRGPDGGSAVNRLLTGDSDGMPT